MVDLDLDILVGQQKTIKILGREVIFKDITMEEHLEAELLVQQLEALPLITIENIQEASKLKNEYLTKIIDITEEEANKLTLQQYQAIRKFINRRDMYDQGFS